MIVCYICILLSQFVGIYVWLNWTTLLFISKFLLSINQSLHPLMIYNHFSPHHFSPHPSIPHHSISPIPSPSSLFFHPLITHHHIHTSHSLCWFKWQRGRYAKYNPDLKLGYECCSTDSISFHYLKVRTVRAITSLTSLLITTDQILGWLMVEMDAHYLS